MMGLRKPAVAAVEELLDRQYQALLSGDLSVLGGMEAALGEAFRRLGREGGDAQALVRIKDTARRNADLIQAAQGGVAQARAHLTQARSAPLTTYDALGRSQGGDDGQSRTIARG